MLAQRLLVISILLPVGLGAIVLGGWAYTFVIAAMLCLAAWEYSRLFRMGGYQPATVLVVAGTLLLILGRYLDGFNSAPWMLSALILVAMMYHLVAYEGGRDQAGTDFAISLAGILYLGWIGAYMISLRQLPYGKWWLLLVLPAVWCADSAAYMIGVRFGRHKLSPRLSPKKSWEGYLAGVVCGVLGGMLFGALWQRGAGPESGITVLRGAVVGFVMGVLPTLGDLGESMIKRQVGVKDSSNLLPGHGGFFDRVDAWLWAAVLGYYLIVWFWL